MEQKVTRRKLKAAIDSGLTPEELAAEVGVSVRKLYTAIRGLYKYAAYAEAAIEQLKCNRKKPVMAAPSDVTVDTKHHKGATENSPSITRYKFLTPLEMALWQAENSGCVVDVQYIIDYFEALKTLPKEKVFVPRCVINTIKTLVRYGRATEDNLAKVAWLEENVTVLERAPSDIWIDNASGYKANTIIMVKHALNVRLNLGYPDAIVLTFSKELRDLMRELRMK